jgi:glutathione peroxidase
MLHRIIIPTVIMATAHAADLSAIPFKDAAGNEISLQAWKGKTVLIVNVASKCGLTPQYDSLEKLYRKHKDAGLIVLAFPCNDFGNQEPGSIAVIQEFCKTRFDVSFPLMAKISVKGKEQHPLYAALTGPEGTFPGDVRWNFGKFLIGRDGKPIARFEPRTSPDDPEVTAAIEKAIAAGKSDVP